MEYKNRYGDVYTFTKQENGNVLMEGEFKWMGVGDDFIDPSGGPFIQIGQMLSHIIYDTDFNVMVEGFKNTENGYLIMCKEHIIDPDNFLHLADTKIIGGIINTTEK